MHRGYIKIWRKLEDWEWFDEPMVFWFFTKLILLANWEDKKWHGITIKRGQFVSSFENLRFTYKLNGKKYQLSQRQVRTLITRLHETHELTSKATNQFTLYTIEKYNTYQNNPSEVTSEVTSEQANERQTRDKRETTTKELKELKELKEVNNKYIKKVFTPPTLQEVKDYVAEIKSSIDATNFFDKNTATGWVDKHGNKYKDWKAVVRTWENWNKKNRMPETPKDERHYL